MAKNKKFFLIIIFLAFLVIILFLVFHTKKNNQSKNVSKFLNSKDPQIARLAKEISQESKEKEEKTAFQLIDSAFESKKIDKNKYILLKTLATFYPSLLPDSFKAKTFAEEGEGFLMELDYYLPNLSEKTKTLIKPFTLAPDNDESFFNPKNKAKRKNILENIAKNL